LAGIWTRDLCLTKATILKAGDFKDGSTVNTLPAPNPGQGSPVLLDDIFWKDYKGYLSRKFKRHTAKCRLIYAKDYSYVLNESNAGSLLLLSNEKRIHVMKALATLSKYTGCYDRWKYIIQCYQLKWSGEDTLEAFNNVMMNDEQNYTSMINWLRNTLSILSSSYGNILLFNTLTGLRPDEACKAILLIHKEEGNYIRKDLMILEHYRFPDIFIRRTKKAYVSIITDSILELAKQASNCGYNALRLAVKRKKLDMNMAYCRKIFATYLRTHGIEQETIDLLQGRVPKSVFARHYFRPEFNYDRIRLLLNSLCEIITHRSINASDLLSCIEYASSLFIDLDLPITPHGQKQHLLLS
jgi:Archaeal phage integrase